MSGWSYDEWKGNFYLPRGRQERDVYVYFDNTARGHAPDNALQLMELIGAR